MHNPGFYIPRQSYEMTKICYRQYPIDCYEIPQDDQSTEHQEN